MVEGFKKQQLHVIRPSWNETTCTEITYFEFMIGKGEGMQEKCISRKRRIPFVMRVMKRRTEECLEQFSVHI